MTTLAHSLGNRRNDVTPRWAWGPGVKTYRWPIFCVSGWGQGPGQETHPDHIPPPGQRSIRPHPAPQENRLLKAPHGASAVPLPPVRTDEELGTALETWLCPVMMPRLSRTMGGIMTNGSDPATVVVLETQVDDLMPQAVGHLYDQLFRGPGRWMCFYSTCGHEKMPSRIIDHRGCLLCANTKAECEKPFCSLKATTPGHSPPAATTHHPAAAV